jgi:hypothetical protein
MKKTYGRPALKKLVEAANMLNIAVDFYINRDGEYVITTGANKVFPPTAAAACFFVSGMINLAHVRFNSIK